MSCFIVSNATIRRVVEAVRRADHDRMPLSECDRLGQELLELNGRAYLDRYQDEEPAELGLFKYPGNTKETIPALVKACDCWLYQCAEGDCDESAVYKLVDESRDKLCRMVVSDSAEYNAAPWDWEEEQDCIGVA